MSYRKKFMRHYGVKGMRWGVQKSQAPAEIMTRRAIDTSKANQSTKAYMAANAALKAENKPKTTEEATANLRANQKKFSDKFDDPDSGKAQSGSKPKAKDTSKPLSDGESKGSVKDRWNRLDQDTKSTIIMTGIYAGLIGGAYIYGKKTDMDVAKIADTFKNYAGKKIDAKTFNNHVAYSKAKSWLGDGYINNASLTRSGFDVPAGNVFHRISTTLEDGFRSTTYSTHNLEDYNRYVTAFIQEKGNGPLYHKTFTTTSPTKVPALTEVLGSLRTILTNDLGVDANEQMTTAAYENLSGGSWKSSQAVKLISALKSKGYGALVDEMDAGVIGESPLVFFDSENAVTQGIKQLSQVDKDLAAGSLIEIANRKG